MDEPDRLLGALFPDLPSRPELVEGVRAHGRRIDLPAEARIFEPGSRCDALAIVVSGCVRAFQQSPSGRRVGLYDVTPGEACVLTTCCVLSDTPFPACAASSTETVAVTIPATVFRDWFARHPFWRDFAVDLVAAKLHALLGLLDSVVFQSVDERVARVLLESRADNDGHAPLTHAQIAQRIGSTRESVSRSIDRFRTRGWVRTARGSIEILEPGALGSLMDSIGTR